MMFVGKNHPRLVQKNSRLLMWQFIIFTYLLCMYMIIVAYKKHLNGFSKQKI